MHERSKKTKISKDLLPTCTHKWAHSQNLWPFLIYWIMKKLRCWNSNLQKTPNRHSVRTYTGAFYVLIPIINLPETNYGLHKLPDAQKYDARVVGVATKTIMHAHLLWSLRQRFCEVLLAGIKCKLIILSLPTTNANSWPCFPRKEYFYTCSYL